MEKIEDVILHELMENISRIYALCAYSALLLLRLRHYKCHASSGNDLTLYLWKWISGHYLEESFHYIHCRIFLYCLHSRGRNNFSEFQELSVIYIRIIIFVMSRFLCIGIWYIYSMSLTITFWNDETFSWRLSSSVIIHITRCCIVKYVHRKKRIFFSYQHRMRQR